jgi:hypothetical protein
VGGACGGPWAMHAGGGGPAQSCHTRDAARRNWARARRREGGVEAGVGAGGSSGGWARRAHLRQRRRALLATHAASRPAGSAAGSPPAAGAQMDDWGRAARSCSEAAAAGSSAGVGRWAGSPCESGPASCGGWGAQGARAASRKLLPCSTSTRSSTPRLDHGYELGAWRVERRGKKRRDGVCTLATAAGSYLSVNSWRRDRAAKAKAGVAFYTDLLPKSSRRREQYSRPTGDCARLELAVPQDDAELRGRSVQERSEDGTRHGGEEPREFAAAADAYAAAALQEKECRRPI